MSVRRLQSQPFILQIAEKEKEGKTKRIGRLRVVFLFFFPFSFFFSVHPATPGQKSGLCCLETAAALSRRRESKLHGSRQGASIRETTTLP
jgi:hypothetical protein